MALPKAEIEKFQCQSKGGCIMEGVPGFWDAYTLVGKKVLFKGEEIGDLSKQSLADVLCYEHCHSRYFDEVLGAPVERKPGFKVISRFSKQMPDFGLSDGDEEENDF